MKKDNIYTMQAKDFLKKANAKMSITYKDTVCGFPFDMNDTNMHDEYTVKIRRDGKSYSFSFYDSYNNYLNGERPTAYDILASVEIYEPYGDVWDFCNEYGYEINDRASYDRVTKIYNACKRQAQKLNRLFGAELMNDLCEII